MYGQTTTTTTSTTTVKATFSDAALNVDGSSLTGSATYNWTPGTSHTVTAATPQFLPGTRYQFVSWSDGAAATHTISAPSASSMLTATFSRDFQVTLASSAGGAASISPPSPDSSYHDGSIITLSAQPNQGYCFSGWSGLVAGTPSPASLTVTKAYSIQANFAPGAVSVSPAAAAISSAGGTGRFSVLANKGCTWTAASSAAWIAVTVKKSGNGSGTVTFAVAANTGTARSATIDVAGTVFTVSQNGL